ncbi:MAG: penicillin acylase family protein, partial [Planctomycetota bacterium JB042]
RAVGATAPGLPGVVIGATDAIAWSMTNFFGDHEDIVPVEVDPDDRSRYRAPDGFRPFETRTLPHPDGRVELVLRTTVYGPIVFPDNLDPRPLALASTALRDGMTNLGLLDLHHVDTLEEALDVGARWYGPSQNLVVAAADGRIGWVVTGCFPKRRGFDGKAPRSWADGEFGWDGLLDESARPRAIVEDGVLFSANGRMLPLERARLLTRCWAPSDRQRRIEELLAADGPFAEADFRAMQLDVDLAALAPFRDVFLEVVPEGEPDPTLARYRAALVDWDGTAAVDQRAVGVLLAFQAELRERVLGPVLERAREVNPGFVHTWMLVDEPLFRLLEERPAHFLPANVPSWTAHLRAAADAIGRRREGRPPLDTPWGERNRLRAAHPFARSLPAFLAGRLAAPAHPQPGTTQTVRVAAPAYGASLRLVASPGHLDEATMHLPIGQSGHPLSPHLMDAHEAWAEGRAEPLLAGPPVSTFTLAPR